MKGVGLGSTGLRLVAAAASLLGLVGALTFTESPATAAGARLWPTTATPEVSSFTGDSARVELGLKFQVAQDGYIESVSFYNGQTNTGKHVASLWSADGKRLARARFTKESASGWQTVTFRKAVKVKANSTYVASYVAPRGNYAFTRNGLGSPVTSGGVTALAGGGVYKYGGGFPTESFQNGNYWVDVSFRSATATPSTAAPATAAPATSTSQPSAPVTSTPTTTKPAPPVTTGPTTTARSSTPTTSATPVSTGWPSASNTGTAGCPALEKVNNGDEIVLNQDGAVYENKELMNEGIIQIRAHNVTIRCVKMHGIGWFGMDNTGTTDVNNYNDVRVSNVDIDCLRKPQVIGMLLKNATVTNANVHDCDHMINAGGSYLTVQNSYCHDLTDLPVVHADCIQTLGGATGLIIRGNSFYGRDTSDVMLGQEFGDAHDVVIENNRFMADPSLPPAYQLYISGTNTVIKNNRFSRSFTYGPCTLNTAAANVTWTGNVWDDNGAPVGLDRCGS